MLPSEPPPAADQHMLKSSPPRTHAAHTPSVGATNAVYPPPRPSSAEHPPHHDLPEPQPAVLRTSGSRSWSESTYVQDQHCYVQQPRRPSSSQFNHAVIVGTPAPVTAILEHHSLPLGSLHKPSHTEKRTSGDSWTAAPRTSSKLELRPSHGVDAESGYFPPSSFHTHPSGERLVATSRAIYDIEAAYKEDGRKRRSRTETLLALTHISLFASLLSLAIMLYSIVVLLAIFLTLPIELCMPKHATIKARIVARLLPPLNFQRRCIFVEPIQLPLLQPPLPSLAPSKSSFEGSVTGDIRASFSQPPSRLPCNAFVLVLTHLFSPIVSLPLTLCAWITALAWLPSAMLSSDKTTGTCDDEQRMAQRLVGWWSSWLDWSRRAEEEEEAQREERDRGRRRERGGGTRSMVERAQASVATA